MKALPFAGCFLIGACVVLAFSVSAMDFDLEWPSSTSLENGKNKINEIMRDSKLPTNGASCWKSALEFLENGCKGLTQEIHTRMTLRFVACFNEMLGLPVYICEAQTPIQMCTKQLDSASLATFRDYFLHTQDMCNYLRQELWQEQTKMAVNRLTDATTDVTMQIEVQKLMQEQIFESQQESIKVQANMKKDNQDMYNTVVKVKDVFDDFSKNAKKHQVISTEIFDKLSHLQNLVTWIQGEMSLLDMILFYSAAMLMGYLGTACQRTLSARYVLLLLFMTSIFIEKFLLAYMHGRDPAEVLVYIWYIRRVAAGVGMLAIVIAGAIYRDPQAINNRLVVSRLDQIYGMLTDFQTTGLLNSRAGSLASLAAAGSEDDGSDSSDDSFSNYSDDDSEDNLDHELKVLIENGEVGNDENREPGTTGLTGWARRFGKQTNSNVSPANSQGLTAHRYNFRERSATPRENAIIHQESPTEFVRKIKMNELGRRESQANYFSSDDEL